MKGGGEIAKGGKVVIQEGKLNLKEVK